MHSRLNYQVACLPSLSATPSPSPTLLFVAGVSSAGASFGGGAGRGVPVPEGNGSSVSLTWSPAGVLTTASLGGVGGRGWRLCKKYPIAMKITVVPTVAITIPAISPTDNEGEPPVTVVVGVGERMLVCVDIAVAIGVVG